MAKLSSGILGGISGTVGNVVGGRWRGIDYIRSKPASVKNPKTEAQQAQRMRFKLVISLLKQIRPLVNIGFRNGSRKQTEMNRAMSVNIKESITGNFPDLEIDPTRLVISEGDLTGPQNPVMDTTVAEVVTLTWQNNGGSGNASGDDGAIALVYNVDTGDVAYKLNGAARSDESLEIEIPAAWRGDTLAGYLVFRSETDREVSDSRYLGTDTAA